MSAAEDRFHDRRWRKHKWIALALGALLGSLAGYANSTFTLFGLPFVAGDPGALFVLLVIVIAPVVEEHVKLLALVFLQAEEQATYTPRRWLVLGAFVGLGFGAAEALLYWLVLAPSSLAAANVNLTIRALLTLPLHALTVSLSGWGYGASRLTGRTFPLLRGLVLAIAIHMAFNTFQLLKLAGATG